MFFFNNNFIVEFLANVKKNNILLEKIFYNYLINPNKIIISDANKSLTWKELVNYSLFYTLKFSKIKNKYIPL